MYKGSGMSQSAEFEAIEEVLTAEEAAQLLRVSTKTVLRQANAGALPCCKVGRAWRFSRAELLDFVAGSKAS